MMILADAMGYTLVFRNPADLRRTIESLQGLEKHAESNGDTGILVMQECVVEATPTDLLPLIDARADQIKAGRIPFPTPVPETQVPGGDADTGSRRGF